MKTLTLLILLILQWGKTVPNYTPPNAPIVLPETLLINGEEWDLVKNDDLPEDDTSRTDGMTYCALRRIEYRSGLSKPLEREILWHEILHAGLCNFDEEDQKKAHWYQFVNTPQHLYVYDTGMFLAGFVHDNPEFIDWAENWRRHELEKT